MENEKFNKIYNSLQDSKRSSVKITLVREVVTVIVVISILTWAFFIHMNTVDKIKVVDQSGNYINTNVVKRGKLINSLIKSHCAKAVYYINSFDRLTIKENQAKSLFLINQKDASRIFDTYYKNNNYNDAIQRGYSFETTFLEINEFAIEEEPYKVKFISELVIEQGNTTQKYHIISTGEIVTSTAQYPENPFGYYFKNYTQTFKKISN